MYRLARALLFLLSAETAHRWGMLVLRLLSRWTGACRFLRARALRGLPPLPVSFAGLTFPSPIGLAAGLDKDAEAVPGLFALGFGAVEVGTLTPRPQSGNPAPRLFRLPAHQALINRMGFNNHGIDAAREHLRGIRFRPGPLGINLGKNKDTPLEQAADDYRAGIEHLGAMGDYLVVNASSPNTPGLRALQAPEQLVSLLRAARGARDVHAPGKPLFLKIAPDLAPEAVDELVDVALAEGVDGLIATNTTIARPFEHPLAKEAGGLSGAPVRERSTEVIRRAFIRSGGRLPIIGVGGVFTAADVYEKLRAGASFVQVYTGLIYEGPGLVRRLLSGLVDRLEADGFSSVQQVIGLDVRTESSSPAAAPSGATDSASPELH